MRWLALVCVVAGCKSKPAEPQAPATGSAGSGSAVAAVTPADAAAAAGAGSTLVELLHNAPTDIFVSSRVANKKILPAHLVDRDLNTAWNSATGELEGAWISVAAKGGALIRELRLTVGHTGKGPKGEDYFTMNPRIRTISVLHGSDVIVTAHLDIARRDLQTIALPAPIDEVKLRVDAVEPGSKKTWRETCVSELEAWGTLGPGQAAKPTTPNVEVGDPDPAPDDGGPIADADAYCAKFLKDATAEYQKKIAGIQQGIDECEKEHTDPDERYTMCMGIGVDPPGAPTCSMGPDQPIQRGPWIAAGSLAISTDSIYGALDSHVAVQTTKGWFVVGDGQDCGHFADKGTCALAVTKATPHGNKLELAYQVTWNSESREYAMTCTYADGVTCDAATETGSAAAP